MGFGRWNSVWRVLSLMSTILISWARFFVRHGGITASKYLVTLMHPHVVGILCHVQICWDVHWASWALTNAILAYSLVVWVIYLSKIIFWGSDYWAVVSSILGILDLGCIQITVWIHLRVGALCLVQNIALSNICLTEWISASSSHCGAKFTGIIALVSLIF